MNRDLVNPLSQWGSERWLWADVAPFTLIEMFVATPANFPLLSFNALVRSPLRNGHKWTGQTTAHGANGAGPHRGPTAELVRGIFALSMSPCGVT